MREVAFWERIDREKKEDARMKTVAFSSQATGIPHQKSSVMGSRRHSMFTNGGSHSGHSGGAHFAQSGTCSSRSFTTEQSSSLSGEVREDKKTTTGAKEKRKSR